MMQSMRSTFRIDDDLLAALRDRARRENISLTRMLNRALREGIAATRGRRAGRTRYREEVVSLGVPRADLDKALALTAMLEDEEVLRRLALRK